METADPQADLALARRVAAGDEAALIVIYDCYADSLFAFVYHHLNRSRPDAEEVWQDTLLAALQAIGSYRGQSGLFTWLCGIARHKIADHLRRRGRKAVDVFSDLPERELSSLTGSTQLPEETLMRKAARISVVEAMGSLSNDYRSALVSRYVDGASVGELARRLGRTYKATESLLSRARAALRDALARLEGNRE